MKCPKCNYDNADEDALYCGLCYEPLKKSVKTGAPGSPQEAAPEESAKAAAGTLLTIALIAGILSGAGVYFYGSHAQDGGQAASALEAVRAQEKILAAENLLAAYNRGRGELLEEISKGKIDPEGFGLDGQYTKKLFRLEEDYADGIAAIQSDCPKCAQDAAYIKWSEDYRIKEAAAMEKFNKEYRQLIRKAGAD
jgi:hypothetical protein